MKPCNLLLAACLALGTAHGQDGAPPAVTVEVTEPAELTRLREQFENRIEREIEPLRALYRTELEKLEQRLVQQDRLADALAVKRERGEPENLNSDAEGDNRGKKQAPKTKEELADRLRETIWAWHRGADSSAEYRQFFVFSTDGNLICSDAKTGTWRCIDANTVVLKGAAWVGTLTIKLERDSASGEGYYDAEKTTYACTCLGKMTVLER